MFRGWLGVEREREREVAIATMKGEMFRRIHGKESPQGLAAGSPSPASTGRSGSTPMTWGAWEKVKTLAGGAFNESRVPLFEIT